MPGRIPLPADFPQSVAITIVPPPQNDPPTNILLLLHGLGDSHVPFATFAQQLHLPETACIALRGPKALLDLEGAHWGDDILFDSATGGIDPDAGLRESTELVKQLIQDVLVAKCGYACREVLVFGFGQGGMVAGSVALSLHQSTPSLQLGGIFSIGGSLPSESPAALVAKCPTPVLVCGGASTSAITPTAEDKFKRVFSHVQIARYRRSGDGMPRNREEMLPIMQFLARRLRSVKGVPEGSVEVG